MNENGQPYSSYINDLKRVTAGRKSKSREARGQVLQAQNINA